MMQICEQSARRRVRACVMGAVVLAAAVVASAQAHAADVKTAATEAKSYETLYLNGAGNSRGAFDIVTDIRNMLPRAKVMYVPEQNAISIYGTPDEIALAKQVLAGVNREEKSYKLMYTLTETGGGQAERTQHVSLLVVSGGSAEVKQGTRVPVVTAMMDQDASKPRDEVQYLDVGLRIKAILDGTQGQLRLHTLVGESQVAQSQPGAAVASDPVIRQTSLDGTSTVAEGKAVSLGSIDLPGTDGERQMKVAVMVEPGS